MEGDKEEYKWRPKGYSWSPLPAPPYQTLLPASLGSTQACTWLCSPYITSCTSQARAGAGSVLGPATEPKRDALVRPPGVQKPSVWSPPIYIAITSSLFALSLPLLYIPWRIFSSPERKSNTYPRYFTQIICLYPETHRHLKDVIIFARSFLDLWGFLVSLFCFIFYCVQPFPKIERGKQLCSLNGRVWD